MKKKGLFTTLDWILLALLVATVALVVWRVSVGLHYKWNWAAIPKYILRYDEATQSLRSGIILQGLFTTIRLSFWGIILATVLGTVMGLCRVSQGLFARLLGRAFVEFMRNLPPLVIIFIFYFFISDQLMPLLGVEAFIRGVSPATQKVFDWLLAPPSLFTATVSALITLSIFEAAYITEIVRAGIQSIERGQWEASYALGLSRFQQMRHIILPQAVQRILPALAGQFISVIKDSAIVSVISVQELSFQGMELMTATFLTFETWIVVTTLYLTLTLSLSLMVERLEIRMGKSRAVATVRF